MTDRPVLFSAPMVRAIVDGRKTQTRRAVKGNPVHVLPFIGSDNLPTHDFGLCLEYGRVIDKHIKCPYGQTGDRLWVRESCHADYNNTSDGITLAKYSADGSQVLYSGPETDDEGDQDYDGSCAHWWYSKDSCPSIHMPRWASRITLEITGVRVERLQEISEADCVAEGCYAKHVGHPDDIGDYLPPKTQYQQLWNHINGPESWAANPWVWVIEFRRAGGEK